MVQQVAGETGIAKEGHKFCHGLIRGQPNHLMCIENGH